MMNNNGHHNNGDNMNHTDRMLTNPEMERLKQLGRLLETVKDIDFQEAHYIIYSDYADSEDLQVLLHDAINAEIETYSGAIRTSLAAIRREITGNKVLGL